MKTKNDLNSEKKILNTHTVEDNKIDCERLKLKIEDKNKYHEYVRKAVEAWDKHNEKKKDES